MDFEQIAKAKHLFLEDGTADIEAAKNVMRSTLSAHYTPVQIEEILALAEMATNAATEVKTLTQLFGSLKETLQSGWAQSWEFIIGDFGEAKALLSGIGDYFGAIIQKSADSRNAMLADWKALSKENPLGGRDTLINGFWNVIHSVENVANVIRGAFEEFFPPTTGKQLFEMTKKIGNFTAKIKAATENSELMSKISRVFRGVAAALDIVRTAAGWAWDGFKQLIGMTEGAAGGFLDFVAGIGDFIVGIRNSIKSSEAFQGILSGLGTAAASVRDLVIGGLQKIGTFFSNLWHTITATGIFTKIGDWFNSFIGKIPEFIGKIKDWGSSIVDWVKNSEALKTAWSNIKGFFEPMISGIAQFGAKLWEAIQQFFGADTNGEGSFWEKVKVRFTAFGEKIGEWFGTIKPRLTEAWNGVKASISKLFTKTIPNFFANLKMKAITKWPWIEKIFTFFGETWAKVKAFCDPVIAKIQSLGAGLSEAIRNLFGGGKSANAPTEVGVSFGETIKATLSKVWNSITTFFANASEKLQNINWGKVLRIAFGVATLVKVIKIASGLGKIGAGFSSIGKGLKNVGKAIKGLTSDGLNFAIHNRKDSFATSLLKIASSVAILVGSIHLLSNMTADEAWTGIGLLTAIAVELLAITFIFKKIDANGDALLKAGAAVALLTIPVYILGKMETDEAAQGVIAVGVILTELVLAVKLANASGSTGKPAFIALAVAVGILAFAVDKLGKMETEEAAQGVIAVGVILTELAVAIRISSVAGSTGKPAFIALAIAVGMLSLVVDKLGNMLIEKAVQGVIAVGVILTELAGAIRISSVAGTTNKPAFMALAVAVGTLSLAVEKLGNMEVEQAAQGVIAVGVILTELAVAIRISSVAGSTGKPAFIALAVAVGILAFAVDKLGKMKTGEAAQGVIAVGVILTELAVAVALMNGAKIGWSTLIPLIPMIAMIGGICYALVSLQDNDVHWTTIAAFCGGLSVAMLALAGATAIMSAIPISGIAKGAAGLAIAAVGIGAAAYILSELVGNAVAGFSEKVFKVGANIDGYASMVADLDTEAVSASITVIGDLAKMAVTVGANDYSGFYAFTSGLPQLGARLSLFNNSVSTIKEDGAVNAKLMVDNIGAIADKMKAMQDNGIDLTLLGTALTNIGSGIELYAYACSDANKVLADGNSSPVDAKTLNSLFSGLEGIELDKSTIAKVAGYAEGGGSDLTSFALGLTAIGNAVQSYKTSIQDIHLGDAIKSAIVLGMINKLQNDLPREGNDVIDWVAGKKQTLSDFAENVVVLGGAMNQFAGCFTEDTAPLAERAVAVIDSLASIQNKLAKYGGVAAIFEGEQDLGALGTNINVLGAGFSAFTGALDGFKGKEETVSKATGIIDSLAAIQGKLDETNGVAQWFTGTKNIGTFGTNLNTFGTEFSNFCKNLSTVTVPTNIEDIKGVVEAFANVAVQLNGVEPYDISNYILWVRDDLKRFFDVTNGIGGIDVDKTKLESIMSFVNSIANIAVKLNGISNVDTTPLQSMLNWISSMAIPDFETEGIKTATAFLSSLSSTIQADTTVPIASLGLSWAGVNAVRATRGSWLAAGSYLGSGIANGISSMAERIRNSAQSAARGAIHAIRITWSINSPSKVGEELGRYWDLGLSGGMDKYAGLIDQSSAGIGKRAMNTAQSVLNNLSYMTDGINSEPTIRPVMDLGDVTNGFQTIDGLFNSQRTMDGNFFGGVTSLRSGRAMMTEQGDVANRNDNRDVVNELQSLSKRFDDLSSAVSNMQVVLDTGVLVGQTASQMDAQLGTYATRRGRGN